MNGRVTRLAHQTTQNLVALARNNGRPAMELPRELIDSRWMVRARERERVF